MLHIPKKETIASEQYLKLITTEKERNKSYNDIRKLLLEICAFENVKLGFQYVCLDIMTFSIIDRFSSLRQERYLVV